MKVAKQSPKIPTGQQDWRARFKQDNRGFQEGLGRSFEFSELWENNIDYYWIDLIL